MRVADLIQQNCLCLFFTGRGRGSKTARELVELNQQRKDMTADGVEEAKRVVEEHYMSDKVLVIYLPQVHESLAGIIAGRIREAYHKPVFVLTKAEEGVKGSGRSIEEYSMYEELCKCRELLENSADIRWRQDYLFRKKTWISSVKNQCLCKSHGG